MALLIFLLVFLSTFLQIEPSVTPEDLKTIFKSKYDDLEIIERSNFGTDPGPTTTTCEPPKAYANAQVFVRMSEESSGKCKCGNNCQCAKPQFVPICFVVPPQFYPPTEPKQPQIGGMMTYQPMLRGVKQPSLVDFSQSGYHIAHSSSLYSDPEKTVVSQSPAVVSVMGPKHGRFICIPLDHITSQTLTNDGTCCCGCRKYSGKLNEL